MCRPAPSKRASRLVFGLSLWPTLPGARLVQAPTDRHGSDLCPVKGALEKLGIVAVLAIVKLKKTWAARKNWLMRPANLTDGDFDQELKHVLKNFGVVRVGGKWQRQEERASSTDSSSDSSEESEGEDKDIDAKMDALRSALREAYQLSSRSSSSEEE